MVQSLENYSHDSKGALLTNFNLFGGVFRGKTIFITGHTGFKGSWLALWLYSLGANVVGYSLNPPTNPSLFVDLGLDKKIIHNIGDVRDYEHLQDIILQYQPDMVFHLAAQPLVRQSYFEPRFTYETNIMGTVNVLEAVRYCNSVRVFINVTSDKCYENKEWDYSYRENDALGGLDPYSSSKGCAEIITAAYRNSFFMHSREVKVATVRAGNVIGGGDWSINRIIPDCIRALQSKEVIVLRNPNAIRPWQFVLEPLSGYLWLASRLWLNDKDLVGPWNFGPNSHSHVSVREIAEIVIKEWGYGSWEEQTGIENQPKEAKLLKLDCSKANHILNWYPVYEIENTLETTIDWFKAYQSGESVLKMTLNDIRNYIKEAQKKRLIWAV